MTDCGCGSSLPPSSPPPLQKDAVSSKTRHPKYTEVRNPAGTPVPGQVIEIHDEDHLVRLMGRTPLLVMDFYASYCGPCRRIEPELKQLAKENPSVTFVKINTETHPNLMHVYKVAGLPSFRFLKGMALIDEYSFDGADVRRIKKTLRHLQDELEDEEEEGGRTPSDSDHSDKEDEEKKKMEKASRKGKTKR